MKLAEAKAKMIERGIPDVPFKLLTEKLYIDLKDKGNAGKLLESLLDMPPGTTLKDFEDGELKTNKSAHDGSPLETMAITQIKGTIDELLNGIHFEESHVYQKIKNLIYLPVVRNGKDFENWYFKHPIHIEIRNGDHFYRQLEKDFNFIVGKMHADILNIGRISTSSGRYIQIRSKDSKTKNGVYLPIYSNVYQQNVANKNHAFYFKKEFMLDLLRHSADYPHFN